jgi:hypothetical protein
MRSQLLLLSLALAACSDDSLSAVFPKLQLCGSEDDTTCAAPLDLGSYRTGEEHVSSLVARNLGEGILELESIEVVSGSAAAGELPGRIGPQGAERAGLLVTPADGDNTAQVVVHSNDPENPNLVVDVSFRGVRPVLVVCPTEGLDATPAECAASLAVAIGELRAGEVRDVVVLVRNTGTAELELSGAEVDDRSTVFGELSVLTSTGRGRLAAGADSSMVVRYQPQDGLADELSVRLLPSDGSVPSATLTVSGSAPDNLAPTAVAVEYDTRQNVFTTEVGQTVWLDGTGSSDPEGDPLQYQWSVTFSPNGSTAQLDPVNGTLSRIIPDRFGGWAVQLQVTDSLSLAGYADFTLDVQPRNLLSVVASWSGDVGDVDLHLVPEGEPLFGASDCYFMQPAVDWGVLGEARDDGAFVADVEAGGGTETIDIRRPADGRWDIWVNYFDSNGDRPAEVTVDVRRDDSSGSVRASEPTIITTTCESWKVGTIEWAAGAATVTLTSPLEPHEQHCYGG